MAPIVDYGRIFLEFSLIICRDDHGANTQITKSSFPTDWTVMQKVAFWIYSEAVSNETITLVMYSDNVNTTGIDYFSKAFKLNFVGWKQISINKTEFVRNRTPVGWDKIDSIFFRFY